MINRRTNAENDQDFVVCAKRFLFSMQFLRCNGTNTSAFTSIHLTTQLTLSTRRWYPHHYLQRYEGCLQQWETASTCNFMKAFTVHATNSAQRQPVATGCIRYTQMCLATYVPCKCTLIRDARRDPTASDRWPSSIFYFTPVQRPKSANKNSLQFVLSQRDRDNRVSFPVSYHFTHFTLLSSPFSSHFFSFLLSFRIC